MSKRPRRPTQAASSQKPKTEAKKQVPVEVIAVGGRPTEYDPKFCAMLISHNREGLSFESFGSVINVGRTTLYRWVEKHEEFRDAKEKGRAHLLNFYEQVVRNVAMGIVPKPDSGMLVTRGNAAAAIYLMKVHGKEAGFQDDGSNKGMGGPTGNGGLDTTVTFNYLDRPEKKVGEEGGE